MTTIIKSNKDTTMSFGFHNRLGKRDRFWLTVVLALVAILFVLRMLSRDGFSDSGKPVWKDAVLGSEPIKDSLRTNNVHAAVRPGNH